MSRKKKLIEHLSTLSPYDLSGEIHTIIDSLQNLAEIYEKKGYSNLKLDYEYGYEGHESEFGLVGERFETDDEYARRLKRLEKAKASAKVRAKKAKEKKKQKEIKLYEKLRRKYGTAENVNHSGT
jgi:hypothetical protein